MELAPERFLGAVLMQPIGFAHATVENEKWKGPMTDLLQGGLMVGDII